jgi:2-polyprenyl-3-methyl-5-hydroxy-6-metoxy-1,4-benzoquinol methylase
MKLLDKILRDWRIRIALKKLPRHIINVLDVGCDDGFLLNTIPGTGIQKYGIDPRLAGNKESSGVWLYRGFFPADIDALHLARQYDAIFALAVLEHFSESALQEFAERCASLLTPHGRLIITVPHPLVDHILELLMSCRLVQAETLDEHHGFDPKTIPLIFQKTLKMTCHKKFQLGLNNLFVFERIS